MCSSLLICWKKYTLGKKYLGYGLLLFFWQPLMQWPVPPSSTKEHSMGALCFNFTTLAVFLLFATGLKEELQPA